ncbi:zinc finger protein 32-like [Phycodurus eques]|uniref:zinc finger protein 32-like n=1 Tax=Phycodurus eques TaxID=693459 RepID=UPI002ACDD687|nr:zinc finger protein 32-like [Phycodurus eques]
MLKELLRERLIAAADEIFGLFEKTVSSYEEQLRRAREESERHRRQLEAVGKTQMVIRNQDVQQQRGSFGSEQEDPQLRHIKEEEEEHPELLLIKEGEEHSQHLYIKVEKADISKLQLTAVSMESEDKDKPLEWSQLRHHSPSGDHRGGPQPENLFVPLSHGDDTEEALRSDADCEGDDNQLKCYEKETTFGSEEPSQSSKELLPCSVCGQFFAIHDMMRHMSTHTGEKPSDCLPCDETFFLKAHVVSHMMRHKEENPFSCGTCGKTFAQRRNLLSHIRIHTGEKPFSCSVCGKRFTQRPHMVSHMRTHTGERPYRCSFCGKGFTQKSNMVSHVRVHTGEKAFSCSVCGQSFCQRSYLTAHMRKKHQENK